jgi:hypothetical protein
LTEWPPLPRYCLSVGNFATMPALRAKGGVVFAHGHVSADRRQKTGRFEPPETEKRSWPELLV